MPNLADKTYWNERAKEYGATLNGVLLDVRAEEHEKQVKKILELYKNCSALDVACGYGRFSDCFTDYTGVDFCEEMTKLGKNLIIADIHKDLSWARPSYDIIFCVIALSSLKMTPQEFNDKFQPLVSKMIIVFELNEFYFFPKV